MTLTEWFAYVPDHLCFHIIDLHGGIASVSRQRNENHCERGHEPNNAAQCMDACTFPFRLRRAK